MTVLLDVTGGLVVTWVLGVGELVLEEELGDVLGDELVGSATGDEVQPASSRTADAASADSPARTVVRVATPPSPGEEPRQLPTEGNCFATL